MSRGYRVRLIAAALTVAAAPFIASAAIGNLPDQEELMTAAVKITSMSFFSTEKIDGYGSGSLILYRPAPAETTAEATAAEPPTESPVSSETAPDPPEEEITYLITRNIEGESEDLSVYNERSGVIETRTYSANGGSNFLNLPSGAQVRNCTNVDNQILTREMTVVPELGVELNSPEPQVLIIHTHATESFQPDGEYYDSEYPARSVDPKQNIVAVGEKIAEKLAAAGICTLHDGTFHDLPLFTEAYDRAEETISALLTEYPSIKVVLDVHRDAIEESDGTPVAAVSEINGREAAQVMIISACGDGYYHVPEYIKNFHFACALQERLESDWRGITRPVLFDYCQYNQHLTPGSLLLEIGSHGNTLEQALYTGELVGDSLARLFAAQAAG